MKPPRLTPDVVVADDGDMIELPPARRDRAHELQLRDIERQARHEHRVRERARHVLTHLSKRVIRELQDPEVRSVFLELLEHADGTDYRKGFENKR